MGIFYIQCRLVYICGYSKIKQSTSRCFIYTPYTDLQLGVFYIHSRTFYRCMVYRAHRNPTTIEQVGHTLFSVFFQFSPSFIYFYHGRIARIKKKPKLIKAVITENHCYLLKATYSNTLCSQGTAHFFPFFLKIVFITQR